MDSEALWRLAQLYTTVGELDQALQALTAYARLHPEDRRRLIAEGQLYIKEGRLDDALRSFNELLQQPVDPRLIGPAHYGRGVALFRMNRPEQAEQDLTVALAHDPANATYASELGALLLAVGKSDRAREVLFKVAHRGEEHPRIFHGLGQAYRDLGQLQQAREYLLRFQELQFSARDKELRREQGRSLLAQAENHLETGRVEEAIAAFGDVLERDPSSWAAVLPPRGLRPG